ncbi:hypothetical protein WBP07_01815 [Novosphingobium sp. BL-8A]
MIVIEEILSVLNAHCVDAWFDGQWFGASLGRLNPFREAPFGVFPVARSCRHASRPASQRRQSVGTAAVHQPLSGTDIAGRHFRFFFFGEPGADIMPGCLQALYGTVSPRKMSTGCRC